MRRLLIILAVLVILVPGCQERQPEEVSGILETSLDVELSKGSVNFAVTLTNISGEDIRLEFPTTQRFDLIVKNEAGEETFRWSRDRAFAPVITYDEVRRDGKLTFRTSWEVGDRQIDELIGEYSAEVFIPASLNGRNIEPDERTTRQRFAIRRKKREIQGLVLISDLDDSIIIDFKYATADNFVGRPVYPAEVAAIHKETGMRLVRANEIFKQRGYTIKVWDAYRPLHVQQIFWDVYPDPRFVARPPQRPFTRLVPRHLNGMSVDITLVDAEGNELEMPTEFDNFTERASATYPHMSQEAKRNVTYLVQVMQSVGFRNYSREWWHFDDIVSTPITYLDVPLEAFLELELVLLDEE